MYRRILIICQLLTRTYWYDGNFYQADRRQKVPGVHRGGEMKFLTLSENQK